MKPVVTVIDEPLVDAEIERAAFLCRRVQGNIWRAALNVWRLWGRYERYALREIAQRAAMDVSTLENWAHAYDFFVGLLKLRNCSEVRRLRRLLTPSHFWSAWTLMRKYGLSHDEMIVYLQEMVVRRANSEPHGAQALRLEVEAHEGSDNAPTWSYYAPRLRSLCLNVLACDAPEEVREAVMRILNFLEVESE